MDHSVILMSRLDMALAEKVEFLKMTAGKIRPRNFCAPGNEEKRANYRSIVLCWHICDHLLGVLRKGVCEGAMPPQFALCDLGEKENLDEIEI